MLDFRKPNVHLSYLQVVFCVVVDRPESVAVCSVMGPATRNALVARLGCCCQGRGCCGGLRIDADEVAVEVLKFTMRRTF